MVPPNTDGLTVFGDQGKSYSGKIGSALLRSPPWLRLNTGKKRAGAHHRAGGKTAGQGSNPGHTPKT
jgi:hypothetical protein